MRRIAMLFILVMALVVSGCTIKPETDRKADQPRAADYSREAGTHTLNVRFLSGEGYVVLVPDRDLSAEEYAERETASATPPATCEVYKDDALMFSLGRPFMSRVWQEQRRTGVFFPKDRRISVTTSSIKE